MFKFGLDIKNAQRAQDELLEQSIRREKGLRQKLQQGKLNHISVPVASTPSSAKIQPEHDSQTLAIDEVCEDDRLWGAWDFPPAADTVDPGVETDLQDHDQNQSPQVLESKKDDLESELKTQTERIEQSTPTINSINWAEPASYKVLAYDYGNDIIKMEDMPSIHVQDETPLSVSNALLQLYQPARFISHVATLQSQDYQVVSASRDLLIFRKVATEPAKSEPHKQDVTVSATPESLVPLKVIWKPERLEPHKQSVTVSSKPFQTADTKTTTSQTSEEPTPQASSTASSTPRREYLPPPTGNYASPTGFVNYDPIFPLGPDTPPDDKKTRKETARRMRRLASTKAQERRTTYQESRGIDPERRRKDSSRRKDSWRRRVRFALGVGVTSAALLYAVGVAAEVVRREGEEGVKGRE